MTESAYKYQLMKASLQCFDSTIGELKTEQYEQVKRTANHVITLHSTIMSHEVASKIQINERELTEAIKLVADQFNDQAQFDAALAANELNYDEFELAIRNELSCEAVLEYICKDLPKMTRAEAKVYYQENPDKFKQTELRQVAHILLTINEQYPENSASKAKKRMREIKRQLTPDNFADLALRHSECPSAMNGGDLGLVNTGLLYAQLDKTLFQMEEGTFSDILESEMGYHLLYCKKIINDHKISFEQACEKICQQHEDRMKKRHQQQWVASIQAKFKD